MVTIAVTISVTIFLWSPLAIFKWLISKVISKPLNEAIWVYGYHKSPMPAPKKLVMAWLKASGRRLSPCKRYWIK
jgi:hypothetical protein